MNKGVMRSRTRDSSWQWLVIGVVLGLGCAAVACLGGYAAGVVSLNIGGTPLAANLAPATVFLTQESVPAFTPTPQVIIVTVTSAGMTVMQPSPTPVSPTPEATLTPTPTVTPAQAAALGGTPMTTPTQTGGVDPRLASGATRMSLVSGGDFQMGTTQQEAAAAVSVCVNQMNGNCQISHAEDSFPPHSVTVNSFQMDVTEVTIGQYTLFLNTLGPRSHLNGCSGQPCAATRNEAPETGYIEFDGAVYSVADLFANLPMTSVTWYGARAYCEALGRRLPTEAEWERAARGTDGRIYPWGNDWDATRANTRRAATGATPANSPVAVGSYPDGASPYGILDMAGNVAEWVNDWYQSNFYSQPAASGLNPQGPTTGTTKVVRGGSWDTMPFYARTVHRQDYEPNSQALFIGFRCVADESPIQPGGASAAPEAGATATWTPVATRDPNITPSPLPSLPPGG